MSTPSPQQPLILTLVRQIQPFIPAHLHEQLEREAPAVSLAAIRLGWEVLDAEQRQVRFSDAVERAGEFPLMGRVYFGAVNLLQHQLTPPIRAALQSILNHTIEGKFEPMRKLLFAIAQRRGDPEAALCRFLLWAGVQLNLLIMTWNQPQIEAAGVLGKMEDKAEEILKELLEVSDIHEPDFRPLHALVAAGLQEMLVTAAAVPVLVDALGEFQTSLTDTLQMVRGLEARDAAIINPGRFTGVPGSQQILDRFPQHEFQSANAIDQRRGRIRKKLASPTPAEDRLVDLLLAAGGGKSSK